MKTILITGASGFIGQKLTNNCFDGYNIITFNKGIISDSKKNCIHVRGDITDNRSLESVCNKYKPDFVIHCAGIAHQKIGATDYNEYFRVNSHASENLAKASTTANPDVNFIFLSSISVYGETNLKSPVLEDNKCNPTSDYAHSKLDAENRLVKLFHGKQLKKLDILRLAPVYDSNWSRNLDIRVFAPGKTAYIKFGHGQQKMSAVSRSNLVDFIEFLIDNRQNFKGKACNTYNVCDEHSYSFKKIIKTFKQSQYQPDRVIVKIPLSFVWILTRLSGLVLKNKKKWFHSCYNKLAQDLIFSNKKMLDTGFKPAHTLTSVFK